MEKKEDCPQRRRTWLHLEAQSLEDLAAVLVTEAHVLEFEARLAGALEHERDGTWAILNGGAHLKQREH